jgi:hypothetical protein
MEENDWCDGDPCSICSQWEQPENFDGSYDCYFMETANLSNMATLICPHKTAWEKKEEEWHKLAKDNSEKK